LIDDPMHACNVSAKGHCQLALVEAWYATIQDDTVARHGYIQRPKTRKVPRAKELLDSVTQFGFGSVVG
jgi:hypothetical protein